MIFGSYMAAIDRILISVMGCSIYHNWMSAHTTILCGQTSCYFKTSRTQHGQIGMQNGALGPYLITNSRVLLPAIVVQSSDCHGAPPPPQIVRPQYPGGSTSTETTTAKRQQWTGHSLACSWSCTRSILTTRRRWCRPTPLPATVGTPTPKNYEQHPVYKCLNCSATTCC
jgi:hypothetical protein